MNEKLKQLKVTRNLLYFLSRQGELEEEMLDDAFQEAGIYPEKKQTALFLDRFLLSTGVIFLICGIVFFLAYNWADLHKFIKLSIVIAMLIASGIYAFLQDDESYGRKIGLVALCGLTGALFAVFGQIYQTGANAYDFFWGWTIMVTVWVSISRFPALWLFYVVLINTTFILYAGQVHRSWGDLWVFQGLFAINLVIWAIWEILVVTRKQFFSSRLFPRTVGLATLSCLVIIMTNAIFDYHYARNSSMQISIAWISWIGLSVGIAIVYYNAIKDLFFLACGVLTAMIVACMLVIRTEIGDEISMFFVMGTAIVIVTYFCIKLFIKLNKKWKQEKLLSEEN